MFLSVAGKTFSVHFCKKKCCGNSLAVKNTFKLMKLNGRQHRSAHFFLGRQHLFSKKLQSAKMDIKNDRRLGDGGAEFICMLA